MSNAKGKWKDEKIKELKGFCLEKCRKLKRQSPETRTAHWSEKDTWPRYVPCRYKTINAENIIPSIRKNFKKKDLSYSLDRPNWGQSRNSGAANGPENIFVHHRRTIIKDDTGINQALEELPNKDSTIVPQLWRGVT